MMDIYIASLLTEGAFFVPVLWVMWKMLKGDM